MTLGLPVSTIVAFLLVLARVSGLIAFLPLTAIRRAPATVRAGLSVTFTLALFPSWPQPPNALPAMTQLVAWSFAEAGLGLSAGLAVAFLMEGFQLAMQVVGLQAGYGYALAVDPSSQADSGILQIAIALFSGLLFFVTGLDHQMLRILAASFTRFPAGTWAPSAASLDGIVRLGGSMLVTAMRLALPVAALLLLIDIALALLGRMQQQLQLLSLAFPVKMLAALALLAVLTPMIARLFSATAERTFAALTRLIL